MVCIMDSWWLHCSSTHWKQYFLILKQKLMFRLTLNGSKTFLLVNQNHLGLILFDNLKWQNHIYQTKICALYRIENRILQKHLPLRIWQCCISTWKLFPRWIIKIGEYLWIVYELNCIWTVHRTAPVHWEELSFQALRSVPGNFSRSPYIAAGKGKRAHWSLETHAVGGKL